MVSNTRSPSPFLWFGCDANRCVRGQQVLKSRRSEFFSGGSLLWRESEPREGPGFSHCRCNAGRVVGLLRAGAIDMGTLRFQKRIQQTAADAAALAGRKQHRFWQCHCRSYRARLQQWLLLGNTGGVLSSCTSSGSAVGNVCVVVNNPKHRSAGMNGLERECS